MLLAAAPGYGKSAHLETQCPDGGVVVSAAEMIRGGIPERATWVGVDDFHLVAPDEQVGLVAGLRARQDLPVVIASRTPLSAARWCDLRGQVSERYAADLALTAYETARLLRDQVGIIDPETALRVADLTAGWPMLVRFAVDALGREPRADLEAALTARGAPAAEWVRANVLPDLPAGAAEVLQVLVGIDPAAAVTQSVAAAVLSELGRVADPDLVENLGRSGVLVRRRSVGRSRELAVVPALALVLRQSADHRPGPELAAVVARAHEADHAWLAAAVAHGVAGDRDDVARLVVERGEDMLRRGQPSSVAQLVEKILPEGEQARPQPLQRTYADALRMSGDPSRARRAFAPLVAQAEQTGWWPGLAVRVAALDYMCGAFESALQTLDRCTDLTGPEPAGAFGGTVRTVAPAGTVENGEDLVDWWASRVNVLAMLGRDEDASSAAVRCLQAAEWLGEPRALGVAHCAVARTCRGTRSELHYDQAMRYATEADDAVTATRVLTAQTWVLLAAARYDQAREPAREAARMARLTAPPGLQAAALHNLGEVLGRVGEIDEAMWQLECSAALCRRLGPARAALAQLGVADLHRLQGHAEQSRTAYVEVVDLARGSGDVQVLVPALCGLALLAADHATGDADEYLAEALRLADGDVLSIAQTTAGRLALLRGDRTSAADHTFRAVATAREQRAADLLANALELESSVTEDPARARLALTEALSIWSSGGARPAVARVETLIGRLTDADASERSRARDAARSLRQLGIHDADSAGGPPSVSGAGASVHLAVLGRFAVTVDGRPVPLAAWRSRQARTLVKILAAHRGRVVTRARLCDLLWPDDDPVRTGHRLSVLLLAVRSVLDPTKAWTADSFITADQYGIRLNLQTVAIDADLLLRDAGEAATLLERGDTERAREVLGHVDTLYRGEAFEDETEEWADGLREEVRAAWIRSVRRLAALRSREGRGAESLGILVRLLAIDPYDEQVHRRLVTSLIQSGRHGEARRSFDRWHQAMSEIGAPLPDPRLLARELVEPGSRAVLTPR